MQGIRVNGGQVRVEVLKRKIAVCAHQHSGRHCFQGVLQVGRADPRARVQRMNHPAGAEKGGNAKGAYGYTLRVVMQRSVGMSAGMRREGDGTHVHRAIARECGCPMLSVDRVAGEDRAGGIQWRRNIPKFFHGVRR